MRRPLGVLALVLAGVSVLPEAARAIPKDTVVLRALDKINGRVSTLEVPVGRPARFGTLEIIPWHCDETPPEQRLESAAFLEIVELRQGEDPEPRFTGWMLASSPGLSALEHPVYDLWVIDCKNAWSSESETAE